MPKPPMTISYYQYDIPSDLILDESIAVDTEAMGLNNTRDRLCVVQIGDRVGNAYIVHFPMPCYEAPNLKKLLTTPTLNKIFHFGRFDLSIMKHYLQIDFNNIFCTKIASRLCRTYTDSHGLKELCSELLGVKLSKQQQSSDWGSSTLTTEQIEYAASDVLYLHEIKTILNRMLIREGREEIARKCFQFLFTRAELDLIGWKDVDIFAH